MATTVLVTSPTGPLANYTGFLRTEEIPKSNYGLGTLLATVPMVTATALAPSKSKLSKADKAKLIPAAVSGMIFASGLATSGMILPSKLFGFLNVSSIWKGNWDPTLATVFAGALGVSMISYQFVDGWGYVKHPMKTLSCPVLGDCFSIPSNKVIDSKLVIGAALFGIGWGISIFCPGPALFVACTGDLNTLFYWLPSCFVGFYAAERIKQRVFAMDG